MAKTTQNSPLLPLALITLVLIGFLAVYLTTTSTSTENLYETQLNQMQSVSTSDDVDAIEEDLDTTDLDSIDSELSEIDSLL